MFHPLTGSHNTAFVETVPFALISPLRPDDCLTAVPRRPLSCDRHPPRAGRQRQRSSGRNPEGALPLRRTLALGGRHMIASTPSHLRTLRGPSTIAAGCPSAENVRLRATISGNRHSRPSCSTAPRWAPRSTPPPYNRTRKFTVDASRVLYEQDDAAQALIILSARH